MRKRLFRVFATSFLIFVTCSLLFATSYELPAVFAATISSGDLIKGPGEAVYYYGHTSKRYVFPNLKTYLTWYGDFLNIKIISAEALAAIPIGGNVTYRPGVKLVKVTTDPKVYAVSSQGTLRWVTSETVAKNLYGLDWNTKVDDVPDAFFTNYMIGADIVNASDFSPAAQTAAAVDINTDKKLAGLSPPLVTKEDGRTGTSTPPVPTMSTSTPELIFTVSKSKVQAGDIETLNASLQDPVGVVKIEFFFDGALVKTCASTACVADVLIPTSGTKSSYITEARATKTNSQVVSQTVTILVQADGSNLVTVRVGQPTIASGQAASAIAEADVSLAVNRIDIYLDGNIIKGCATGARICRWSEYFTGTTGSAHPVFAKVTDNLGRTYVSKTVTLMIGINDLPGVTVSPAKSTIYTGEMVEVTVAASDNDGIASIEVMKDGAVLKKCDSAAPCTAMTGPWNVAGTVLNFTGRATDAKGNSGTSTESAIVSVVAR